MKIELEIDDSMFEHLPDSVQDSLINGCAVATEFNVDRIYAYRTLADELFGGDDYRINLGVEIAPDDPTRLYVLHQGVTTKVGTMKELNRFVDPESILVPRFYKLGNEVDVEVKTHTSYEVKK